MTTHVSPHRQSRVFTPKSLHPRRVSETSARTTRTPARQPLRRNNQTPLRIARPRVDPGAINRPTPPRASSTEPVPSSPIPRREKPRRRSSPIQFVRLTQTSPSHLRIAYTRYHEEDASRSRSRVARRRAHLSRRARPHVCRPRCQRTTARRALPSS
jgi:hypothetical protein